MAKKQFPWQDKINNHHAVGGIETAVLDNGLARGTRIAWVNTGSPLRYKVVIDRGLDIADASFSQHSLGWFSHNGITAPRPDANRGLEWLYSFGGGLLTTCGLTHIGGPEGSAPDERGLHGRVSNIPAEIESVVQPDPVSGKLRMSITGTIKQSRVFGPMLELRRTITSTLGEPVIHIKDVVTNCGSVPAPHMILYHCNFGWPLVDEGTRLIWKGKCESFGREGDNEFFNNRRDYTKCPAPLDIHRGGGEACCVVDATSDSKGVCTVGLHNPRLAIAMVMRYKKKQLPCLTNWQHWGFGEYVTALEPGTNPPFGQDRARAEKKLILLKPGQSKTYELEFEVLNDPKAINKFLKTTGK